MYVKQPDFESGSSETWQPDEIYFDPGQGGTDLAAEPVKEDPVFLSDIGPVSSPPVKDPVAVTQLEDPIQNQEGTAVAIDPSYTPQRDSKTGLFIVAGILVFLLLTNKK